MPYRMVTNVGKLSGRLAGAAVKHTARIVGSLTERWQDQLEEGEELTVTKLLECLSQDLEQTHAQVVDTENQLRSEIREDKTSRFVRDRAVSDVRELLFDVKKVCDAFYGPGSAENLFEEDSEDIPSEANDLFRLGQRVRRNMADPGFPMPPLKHGIGTDLAALAARFDQPLAELGSSLKELHAATQGSSGVIADKERDLGEVQKLVGRAGRFLESITSLAGHEGVARRIRLSQHRARAGIEEPEEPDGPEDETEVEVDDVASEDAVTGRAGPDIPPESRETPA